MFGPEPLVADHHLVFVKPVFVPPAPVGPRPNVAICGLHLRQGDKLAAREGAPGMGTSRALLKGLTFIRQTIAVLGKNVCPLPVAPLKATYCIAIQGRHWHSPSSKDAGRNLPGGSHKHRDSGCSILLLSSASCSDYSPSFRVVPWRFFMNETG